MLHSQCMSQRYLFALFSIALVPHTLEATTLGALEPGTPVNLEVDVLAKYVERLLDRR